MVKTFDKPEYPKILTKKNWDKKKGVFAKMHGATGIGEEMTKTEKLYDNVDWEKINIGGRVTEHKWKTLTKKFVDDTLKEAKSEVDGNLAKFSKGLYSLRDLAKKTADEFKKSKTIPKSSRKLCEEIASEADTLGVTLNKNSMYPIIKEMHTDFVDFVDDNYVNLFPAGLKKVVVKHANTLNNVKKDPTPKKFEDDACGDMARDYTTGLGNIAKCADKGFITKQEGAGARKLFDLLTPYANLRVTPKENEEILKHLEVLEKLKKAVELYASKL